MGANGNKVLFGACVSFLEKNLIVELASSALTKGPQSFIYHQNSVSTWKTHDCFDFAATVEEANMARIKEEQSMIDHSNKEVQYITLQCIQDCFFPSQTSYASWKLCC
jgi:hypothetical protein